MGFRKKLRSVVTISITIAFLLTSILNSFASDINVSKNDSFKAVSSDTDINQSKENSTQQRSYLIGLKESVDRDKFIKKKSLDKKSTKKFKNLKTMAVDLDSNELHQLENDSNVLYIENNATVQIASIGQAKKDNSSVKKMKNDTQSLPWGLKAIGADVSLENKADGNKIKIAVLDTGCSNHPDLKIKGGVSLVPYTSSYVDDNGHGTHVTGTIAAQNNKIGVVGVAPEADIYEIKVIDNTGTGTYSQIIDGIEWAMDNKINIINMSFGGMEDSRALHDIIKEATNKGIIIVAAAGNNGYGAETEVYPARYPEAISVGAVDQTLKITNYSSTGNEVDIVAPGSDILSTTADGEYGVMSGTSMATPHITGVVASLWSKNKKWSNQQVKDKLYQTATPLGEQTKYGHGLVNEAFALGLSNQPIVQGAVQPENPVENPPNPSVSFDSKKNDIQLAEYKNKLRSYFDIANQNGAVELAKDIQDKLNELIVTETKLCALPDTINTVTKETDASAQALSQINTYYASKANDFSELDGSYRKAIEEFGYKVLSPNIVNVEDNSSDSNEIQSTSNTSINVESNSIVQQVITTSQETPSANGALSLVAPEERIPEKDAQFENTTAGALSIQSTPSISVLGSTANSVTINVVFPTSGAYGNSIQTSRQVNGLWITPSQLYYNNWYVTDGTYTLSGFEPGSILVIFITWYDQSNVFRNMYYSVQLQYNTPESLVRTDGTYVYTSFESGDMALAQGSNYSRWLGHMDSVYSSLKDLVGFTPYNNSKIELKSVRSALSSVGSGISYWTYAYAGNPAIFWQSPLRQFMIRVNSDDWGDSAVHELCHDFDNYAWVFDAEFFAELKQYYIAEALGAKFLPEDQEGRNIYYSGAQLANFYKTDAYYSYDNTFAKGTYDRYGLTSIFIRIKNTIGWQPFKDTFRYFNNLTSSQIPTTNIGKFNLFIGKLSEYSNYDVRSLFTSNEISIIQNYFGGTIAQNYDAQLISDTIPTQMEVGKTYNVNITVKNTGLNTWTESKAYRLGAIGESDPFTGSRQYLSSNDSITNGQTKTFNFMMTAPTTIGTYTTDWQMIRDGYSWYGNVLVSKQINVVTPQAQNMYLNSPIDVDSGVGVYSSYKFTPAVTGIYNIFTGPYGGTGSSNDTYLELYTDSAMTNRIAFDDDSVGNLFSKISTTLTGGISYYIKLRPYNATGGSVHARIQITREIPNIYINSPIDVDLGAGLYNVYKFIPTVSGTFSIFTGPYGGTGSSNDTYLELFTDSALTNRIAYNDDGAGNLFSKIEISLVAGTAYYIKLRHYNATTGAVHARLAVTKIIPTRIIYQDTPTDMQVAQNEYGILKFTPTSDGLYKFYTGPYAGTGGSSDTYLELYSDQNLTNMISYNDDYNGTLFSSLQFDLYAGTTYYLKFRGFANNSASARITVNKICDAYGVQIISDTIPTEMVAGMSYQVSITIKNTGSRTWTEANSYRLGALSDSATFSASRQYLSSDEAIAYGQTKSFSFTMMAPNTAGTYSTGWRMVRDGYSWFGDTLTKSINVSLGIDYDGDGLSDSMENSGIPIGYNGKYITTVYLDPAKKDTDGDELDDGVELINLKYRAFDSSVGRWYYEIIDNPRNENIGSFIKPEGVNPNYEQLFGEIDAMNVDIEKANVLTCNNYVSEFINYRTKIEGYISSFSDDRSIQQVYDCIENINLTADTFNYASYIFVEDILLAGDSYIPWIIANSDYLNNSGVGVASDVGVQGISDAVLGTKVHVAIEALFKKDYDVNGFTEVKAGPFRVDCVYDNINTRIAKLYEIKPITYSKQYNNYLYTLASIKLTAYCMAYSGKGTHEGNEPAYKISKGKDWNINLTEIPIISVGTTTISTEYVVVLTFYSGIIDISDTYNQNGMVYYMRLGKNKESLVTNTAYDPVHKKVTIGKNEYVTLAENTALGVACILTAAGLAVVIVGDDAVGHFEDDVIGAKAIYELWKEAATRFSKNPVPIPNY